MQCRSTVLQCKYMLFLEKKCCLVTNCSSTSQSIFCPDPTGFLNNNLWVMSRRSHHSLSWSCLDRVCNTSSTSNDSFFEFYECNKSKQYLSCPYRQNFYFHIWSYIPCNELWRKKFSIWMESDFSMKF